jgi:hypothetical protein
MRMGDVAWTASNVTIGNIPHYVLRSVRKLESNITPKTLFESGKYRDIETASEVFILMKKIETLEGILDSARKLLTKRQTGGRGGA